jgi:type IV fimbrial biogenesis protein FimT
MTPLAQRSSRGFTMVELVIVVVIIGIIATIALPSFNDTLVANRLTGQTNDLIAGINLARTASIQLNSGGGICAANANQTDCGGSWDNGWIVWADVNRNTSVDAGEIRSVGTVDERDLMLGVNDIRFDGRGRRLEPPAAGNAVINLTPRDCASGKPFTRAININAAGSVNVTRGNC